jgi:hypothetical protein
VSEARNEQEAAAEAGEDRIYWATWEENHYPQDGIRKLVVAERCYEAGYPDWTQEDCA